MARFFPSLSIFEKVLVANSVIILVEALAAWWVTSHALEPYHYLIDTSFLVATAVVVLLINALLLRAAFRPLFGLLNTIQLIEAGRLDCRAQISARDSDVAQVAAALNAMLDRLEAVRHQTAGEILHVQEQERRRLALELHDQSSQTLTALTLHAQVLEDLLAAAAAPSPALLRQQVAQVNQLAGRTMSELRHVAEQLRPAILDDLGLEAALRWLAEDVGQGTKLRIAVQVSGVGESEQDRRGVSSLEPSGERLPPEVETALFRIAQEGLTNVARHAQASSVELKLLRTPEQVTLMICDDGRGFPSSAGETAARRAGLGVTGMQERARLLGGKLEITPHPDQGTVIQAIIPLALAQTEQRSR
jgi:two-component system sensor histidine kinase UhpB